MHQGYGPRRDPDFVTVCDPLPADGRTYGYRARAYDTAGNHSPYSEIRATLPTG